MGVADNLKRYLIDNARVDRLPRLEMMPYHEATIARWRGEGLPDTVQRQAEFHDYFGLTSLEFFFVFPDVDGMACRERIRTMDDFRAVREGLYDPLKVRRRLDAYRRALTAQDTYDGILWVPLHGFFWHPRDLFGVAEHLMMFCTAPDLMHEVNKALLEFNVGVVRMLYAEGIPAVICVSEDMAFKLGSMISKEMFDEFMAPYHRVLAEEIRQAFCIAAIDSDGDITHVVSWFQDAGYQCINPMERQTGMDLAAMRAANPEIAFMGGYNKLVMRRGADAIQQEFASLKPLFRAGRFIPAVDHQTPPEVSLENYRHYLRASEAFFAEMVGGVSTEWRPEH